MELQIEDKLILSSIKIEPSPVELEYLNWLIPLVHDWDYLITILIDRGIAPLLFKKLPLLTNSSFIPEPVKTKLQQAYYKTFSRSTILYEHFRKIAVAFTTHNISLIALKGVYLSEWLYQDIGLRQFSDIDLLVKEEDASKCIAILSDMGYNPYTSGRMAEIIELQFEKDIVHYPPMVKDGVSIEIHIKLHSKNQLYNVLIPTLWSNAIPATINGIRVSALNNTDLLIHLCLHLDKHFRGGHVQFTSFNDITNLLEKYSETMNWIEFAETCRFYNCVEIVFEYIVMVNKYINATVPDEIIQKYSYLLTGNDEKLFCNCLIGEVDIASIVTLSCHFVNLNNFQKYSNKIIYLLGVLFPSNAFMINRYHIKKPSLVFFYYPYRYWIGVRGVVNYLFKKR